MRGLFGAPLAVIGWRWSGAAAPDAWALAGTALAVAAGAGVVVWLGVVGLVPGPDPQVTRDHPLDHADVTAQSFASLALIALAVSPLAGATAVGWSGATLAAVGLAYASALWWLAGTAAAARLGDRAPDLLLAMRSGTTTTESNDPLAALTPWQQTALWSCVLLGLIALVPQAIVPAAMKLTGQIEPVWFLALHAPQPWQWPVIAAMAALAAALFATSYALYRKSRSSSISR